MSKASDADAQPQADTIFAEADSEPRTQNVVEFLITEEMAQAILNEVDLDGTFVQSDEEFKVFLEGLRELYLIAFGEFSRRSKELRSLVDTTMLEDTAETITEWRTYLDRLEPAVEFLQASSVYRRAVLSSGDSNQSNYVEELPFFSDVSARLNEAIIQYAELINYAQQRFIEFDSLDPTQKQTLFFEDLNPLAAQAMRAMYPFLRDGKALQPEHYIARSIANLYRSITGQAIPYNGVPKDMSIYQKGERVAHGSRQFYDGVGLRLLCVIIRDLKLYDFITKGAPSDPNSPFPWQELDIDGKSNPWEVTKNRFANIWDNDKKRADRDHLFGGDPRPSPKATQTP